MDIFKLKKLADTVELGVVEFPEISQVVAFNMSYEFFNVKHPYMHIVPLREDIPDRNKVTACACGIGFTLILFSPMASRLKDDAFIDKIDMAMEASLILGLTRDQATDLFYGSMSSSIPGSHYAKVIRNLILTEKVDWLFKNTNYA